MFIFIIAGLLLSGVIYLFYSFIKTRKSDLSSEIPWKKSLIFSLKIYIITLFLGSVVMVLTRYVSTEYPMPHQIIDVILQSFAVMFFAFLFSSLVALPALILSIKALSLYSYTKSEKENIFILICVLLVFFINAIMSGFFRNPDMLIMLSGFSVFGILVPWLFIKRENLF
jgi:hypothetical protein